MLRKIIAAFLLFSCGSTAAQYNSLVVNGAYLVLNGGTFGNNIELVVNQGSTNGIARNSGHIISEGQYNYVRWNTGALSGNYIFPFGNTTGGFLPLSLNKTSAGAAAIIASTWGTQADNLPFADSSSVAVCTNMNSIYGGSAIGSVIDRWWDIINSAPLTANLTFTYAGAENTTAAPTGTFGSQRWNGGQWLLPAGSATGTPIGTGTLTVPGVSVFSPFVLVNMSNPLPIELIAFEAYCFEKEVHITWSTATETNNSYFTLERSTDNVNWTTASILPGAGNSNQLLNYSISDNPSFNPVDVLYYRLRQTDYNGEFHYSGTITVKNCAADPDWFMYPNPANTSLTIDLGRLAETLPLIELYSIEGKKVKEFNCKQQVHAQLKLSLEGLGAGIYFIRITDPKNLKSTVKKLIIEE